MFLEAKVERSDEELTFKNDESSTSRRHLKNEKTELNSQGKMTIWIK